MPRRRPERFLTTVLFTDIVGSTELLARLGDRGWRDLLARHHTVVRKRLRSFEGREMDTAGDGFFARFDQPARALACAQAVADDLRAMGIEIRAGLHMGEVEVAEGKVGGMAVHIGARIASQAKAGEVLVSGTVKDLVTGSGLVFADRGDHELKGVPGTWHLFALEWDRPTPPAPSTQVTETGAERPWWSWVLRPVGLALVGAAAALALILGILVIPNHAPSAPRSSPGASPTSPRALPGDGLVGAIRLDPANGSLQPIPFQMAISAVDADKRMWAGKDFVWIVDGVGSTIEKLNPTTGARVNTIPLLNVNDVAELDGVLWATQARPDGAVPRDVIRISPVENTPIGSPIDLDPCCGGIVSGGGFVWVLTNARLVRIDPKSLKAKAIDVSGTEITFGEDRVWALDSITGHYSEVDPTGRVVATTATPHDSPVAIAAGFGAVWIADAADGVITKIDLSGRRANVDIPVGDRPNDIAIGLDAVFVSSLGDGTVTRIDPVAEKATDTYHTGGRPSHLVVWGRYVWVAMDLR